MGLAKLHVPRFSLGKPQAGGNIGCRLIPGPSGSGQWHLQLSVWGCAQLTRKRGQGHSSDTRGGCHLGRQDLATWGRLCGTRPPQPSPPSFVPGHNCDPSSWLPLYVEHIMQHPELTGCVLACYQPPFTRFTQWLRSRGLRWDGPLVPMLASPQQRLLARTAEGQQAGRYLGKRPAFHCSHLGSLPSSASSTAWLERTSHCRRSSHP